MKRISGTPPSSPAEKTPTKWKSGTAHKSWKGDSVGYVGVHEWVRYHLGKPRRCGNCKTTKAKAYDWANVSGEYKRDLNDYIRLCRSCHKKLDYNLKREKESEIEDYKNDWWSQ